MWVHPIHNNVPHTHAYNAHVHEPPTCSPPTHHHAYMHHVFYHVNEISWYQALPLVSQVLHIPNFVDIHFDILALSLQICRDPLAEFWKLWGLMEPDIQSARSISWCLSVAVLSPWNRWVLCHPTLLHLFSPAMNTSLARQVLETFYTP